MIGLVSGPDLSKTLGPELSKTLGSEVSRGQTRLAAELVLELYCFTQCRSNFELTLTGMPEQARRAGLDFQIRKVEATW